MAEHKAPHTELSPEAKKAGLIMDNLKAEDKNNMAEGYADAVNAVQKLGDKSCDPETFKAGAKFFGRQVKLLKGMDKTEMTSLEKLSVTNRQSLLRHCEKIYNELGKSSPEIAPERAKQRQSNTMEMA